MIDVPARDGRHPNNGLHFPEPEDASGTCAAMDLDPYIVPEIVSFYAPEDRVLPTRTLERV